MALDEYRRKRDFARTPEPAGGVADSVHASFVVQKHAARRLHYDFRLELDGVLKSWAVTRQPNLDPGSRRLAVHVEDHPLEYGGFEGVIPKGQYGGGTVMLWDRGTWQAIGDPRDGYAKGKLKFRLNGQRLKGGFALVRMKGEGGRNWLLIKEKDEAAGGSVDDDISVVSGRSMDDIAAQPDRVWVTDRAPRPDPAAGGVAAAMPERLSPMLASLVDRAPDGPQWLHEIKFDGYRMLARIETGRCRMFTRNGHDWTARFPTLATACASLSCRQAWLDGEVVALDRHGVSRFHQLQATLGAGDAGLVYHLFDLLYLDGHDLTKVGLEGRKSILKALLPAEGPLRYTDHLDGQGAAFQRQVCAFALEGVVSKRRDRPYRQGRGKDWVKVKCASRQEFVIAGWAPQAGRKSGIGSLVLGVFDGEGRFIPTGRVGSGFGEREAAMLEEHLKPLIRPDPPFPTQEKGVTWVEPKLVAEVAFTEWTPDGLLRHPSYQGLRLDKDAAEVVRERLKGRDRGPESAGRLAAFPLTSPDKVLYPEQGLTKRALAAYYLDVADWILPLVAGRPLTLVRCPHGAGRQCFYQRHPHAGMPKAIRRIPAGSEVGGEVLIGIDDLAGLIGLVQMGALEIHTWGAPATDIDHPDTLVFDLDPDEGLAWAKVVAAAKDMRARLEAAGLAAFLKTTGGKGLHVVVPLRPGAGWGEAKAFSKAMAEAMAGDSPAAYTANMAKVRRKGRIYVDYLRNQRAATFIAPYSTRARTGAPVAVPITWGELDSGLRSDHFTVDTLSRRLASLPADPWAGMRERAAPLPRR